MDTPENPSTPMVLTEVQRSSIKNLLVQIDQLDCDNPYGFVHLCNSILKVFDEAEGHDASDIHGRLSGVADKYGKWISDAVREAKKKNAAKVRWADVDRCIREAQRNAHFALRNFDVD